MTQEMIQQESQSIQHLGNGTKRRAKKHEVILTPELYEAVLESVQQAQDGKVINQAEARQRAGL